MRYPIGFKNYSVYDFDSTGDGQTCKLAYIIRIWNKSTSEAVIELDNGDAITLDADEKLRDVPIACSTVDIVTLADNSIEILGVV